MQESQDCYILPEVSHVHVRSCQKCHMCMLHPARSVTCACYILPEVSHVHAGQQEIIILISNYVTRPAVNASSQFFATWGKQPHRKQRCNVLLATSLLHPWGITEIEDRKNILRQNIFPIRWVSYTFLQYVIAGFILTLLWHACQVTVLLFFALFWILVTHG
jgi:hypothetical protein